MSQFTDGNAEGYRKVPRLSRVPSPGENRTQIASDINGKPDGNIEGRASTCSPLIQTSNTECEIVKVISITEFFYDDQNAPYTPLPGSAVIIIQTQIEKKGKKEKVTTSMS